MIIAVPVDENKEDVCVSFGRTPYFLIKNTDTGETEYLANPGAGARGGAGIKTAQLLINHRVETVLTIRCGENAAGVLRPANIGVYKTTSLKADESIAAYLDGKLSPLTQFHAGFMGGR